MVNKAKGVRLFRLENGGSYEVFNKRPLRPDIVGYCIQDVLIMPLLWTHYNGKLTATWRQRVMEASKERVRISKSPSYIPQGRHQALAPAGWDRL